ncbi:MAG: S26 family signal peptidase [Thermoplasmata archaeon]|nr:S26 family signal peptidase [Thermoplasmata archaeon]
MESEPEDKEKKDRKRKWIRSILFLLRDLGVAALIVGIILLSLFLYTGNWPPMVVVESKSMQHSDTESFVGVIDTGDLVLVQNAHSKSDIITYVEGRATGYGTYGEFGDVIIYKQGGNYEAKSIIHRALIRLDWNESSGTIDIPDLDRLELGADWSGKTSGGENVTSPYGLNGTIMLYHVGFADVTVTLSISGYIGQFSGNQNGSAFVALGDNNDGNTDPRIIRQDWIEGRARGEIPWFGLLKLTLFRDPGAPCCSGWNDPAAPLNSWDALLIAIVLIIAVPIALDFGISYALDFRRKRKEAAEEAPSEATDETTEPGVTEPETPLEEEAETFDDLDGLDADIEELEEQMDGSRSAQETETIEREPE